MTAILIIITIALYLLVIFLAAWFLGRLMHFCMNDDKEENSHDHDAQ